MKTASMHSVFPQFLRPGVRPLINLSFLRDVDDLDVEIDRRTVEGGRVMLESTEEAIGGVSC